MARLINAAIFASGTGTNAINILEYAKEASFNVCCLVTDNPDAGILDKLESYGIKVLIAPIIKESGENFKSAKARQESDVLEFLKQQDVNWLFLAGYMRILSENFLNQFHDDELGLNRVINIHPSILPAFPGADGYGEAYESGCRISGATIHFVDGGVDTGPIIEQVSFVRKAEDTFDDFKKRGLSEEYKLYRKVLNYLCQHKITLKDIPNSNKKFVHIGDML